MNTVWEKIITDIEQYRENEIDTMPMGSKTVALKVLTDLLNILVKNMGAQNETDN